MPFLVMSWEKHVDIKYRGKIQGKAKTAHKMFGLTDR